MVTRIQQPLAFPKHRNSNMLFELINDILLVFSVKKKCVFHGNTNDEFCPQKNVKKLK